jgi:Sulfotransferase family
MHPSSASSAPGNNTWSVLAGSPRQKDRKGEMPPVPGPAIDGIRHTVSQMTGQYLARQAKKRYCDKSLDVARHADLLVELFPGVRFICLYRHPMDVIASGLESCPWGLKGFGFEDYAAGSPTNAVLALARFWADHTGEILAPEHRYPDRCHRVRYEDLATDPEGIADGIFAFLGVPRPASGNRQVPRAYLLVGELLQAGLFRVSARFAQRWQSCSAESFFVIVTPPSRDTGPARWRVDLAARTVTLDDGTQADGSSGAVSWQITGSATAWERVIAGTANLNVALRRRELRFCDTGTEAATTAPTRISMLADLLGITSWRSPADAATSTASPGA